MPPLIDTMLQEIGQVDTQLFLGEHPALFLRTILHVANNLLFVLVCDLLVVTQHG